MSEIELGNEYLFKTREQGTQVFRKRIQNSQVQMRHDFASFLKFSNCADDGAMSPAPAHNQQITFAGAFDFGLGEKVSDTFYFIPAQLAHEAYVELVTRKAALKIEEEHDVFTEIYDSWYALFGEIRRLARKLDADEVSRNAHLRRLHELLVDVLNRGLRPHLTRWQSRFRRWYVEESRNRPSESAQDIQRSYPEYPQLVASLKEANHLLINLARELRRLAYGDVSS